MNNKFKFLNWKSRVIKYTSWYQIVDTIKIIQPSISKVCRFVILSTMGMSEYDWSHTMKIVLPNLNSWGVSVGKKIMTIQISYSWDICRFVTWDTLGMAGIWPHLTKSGAYYLECCRSMYIPKTIYFCTPLNSMQQENTKI